MIASAGLAIGLGTYIGGWRIIRTMGNRLTDIAPPQGFAAEASSIAVILNSAQMGFALSTTHVVAGSVLGTGLGRRLAEARWSVAGQMALAWLLTLPAAAAVGAVAAAVAVRGTLGVVVLGLVALAVAVAIYAVSRRQPVTANNVNDVPPPRARHAAVGTATDCGGNGTVVLTGAVLCFAACAAVLLYSCITNPDPHQFPVTDR